MNWLETILVTLGVSLDIFAAMACKGAQLSKIEKKTTGDFVRAVCRMADSGTLYRQCGRRVFTHA